MPFEIQLYIQSMHHGIGLGGTEIFYLQLLQSSALAIIAIIAMSGIETKYVVKLDLHLNLVHYYGPCGIQMRHSYITTAQFAVRNQD